MDTNELIFTTTLTVGDLIDLANYMADEETEIEVTKEQIEVLRERISDAVMSATQSFIDDNFG